MYYNSCLCNNKGALFSANRLYIFVYFVFPAALFFFCRRKEAIPCVYFVQALAATKVYRWENITHLHSNENKFETKNDENSEDDDEDFEDLEFSGSDSDEEHKTPAKNVNNSSTVDKKDVKKRDFNPFFFFTKIDQMSKIGSTDRQT